MVYGLTRQCFTGETLVSTKYGLCPIEEIQEGDYVWSENSETGEKELKKVLSVSITETETLVYVITENGTKISTTQNHPFYVEGKGWVAAAELESGDMLRTQEGKTEKVFKIETEKLEEAVKVYNLEIEDNHTYYVSADEVLVHNECGGESGSTSKYLEQLDSVSENKINHMINGSKNSNHGWENLVPDKNWNGIKNIIADVMDTGVEGPYKSVFSKKAVINGFEVEVTYTKLSDGTIRISDAWVNQ